ncbi:MAG: GMC family oxidoreductase [Haloarculaceae archaeon]
MLDSDSSHDYVIVGAGSAGCVLANRLSEAHDVLLLEAGGPDDRREISVPIAHTDLLRTEVDWGFETVPQPGLRDRTVHVAQGRTIGGSSSINAQMYFRGHPADYDEWAAAGNEGWDYESVRPHFERIEDGPGPPFGTGGPQHVAPQSDPSPVTEAFVDAAVETGFPRRSTVDGPKLDGVGFTHVVQKDGKRHSAADAFLKPVVDRARLTAETGATVRRVLFDGTRATGVAYDQDGERKRATVTEEVILSAGAINSPQLLLLSGVGPAEHLASHGVDVIADSPGVGRNLHDHPFVWVNYDATTADTYDGADTLVNLAKYLLLQRGPLTSNGTEAAAFWCSREDADVPDVQLLFAPAQVHGKSLADRDGHGFSIGVAVVHPRSRGRVRLTSGDPEDDPEIDPAYLDHDDDVEGMVQGVLKAQAVAEAEALAPYRDDRYRPEGGDREAALDHVRSNAASYFHFAGSCRMGDDDRAVVDDRLRVHGVDALRVVDASIMPTIPRVNTHAPTMMVAERAARLIRTRG